MHTELSPTDGWPDYGMSQMLLDYVSDLIVKPGWLRMSFCSGTLVLESRDSGGQLYLEFEEPAGKISYVALYPPAKPDAKFEKLQQDLSKCFNIYPA